jgi:hypothetical protein
MKWLKVCPATMLANPEYAPCRSAYSTFLTYKEKISTSELDRFLKYTRRQYKHYLYVRFRVNHRRSPALKPFCRGRWSADSALFLGWHFRNDGVESDHQDDDPGERHGRWTFMAQCFLQVVTSF